MAQFTPLMQRKYINNTVKLVPINVIFPTLFLWCYAHLLHVPMGPKVDNFHLP